MNKHKQINSATCGEVVSVEKVGAERYTWWDIHPLSPYDTETGEPTNCFHLDQWKTLERICLIAVGKESR